MKKTFYLLIAIVCITKSYSQKKETIKPCATDELMQDSFKKNPSLKSLINSMDSEITKKVLANNSTNGATYTIPVVVYVVHDGGASNISDNQDGILPNGIQARFNYK